MADICQMRLLQVVQRVLSLPDKTVSECEAIKKLIERVFEIDVASEYAISQGYIFDAFLSMLTAGNSFCYSSAGKHSWIDARKCIYQGANIITIYYGGQCKHMLVC